MISLILAAAIAAAPAQPLQLREDNIPEIVAAMTPEEKVLLLVGGRAKSYNGIGNSAVGVPGSAGTVNGIPRLGIPTITLADGPAGLRISAHRDGEERTYFCTGFPIATLLASTWNTELVTGVGKAMGNEVLEYGVDVLLAPGANIHRNPLCGRNFEYYSEDPLLSGTMAAAFINGVESNGVGTSLKHFALNNQELNRLSNDDRVSQRALMEIYLKNFEIAVKQAQPWTVMTSYNYINGIHAAENTELLTELLRGEWGFEGAVMTDWGGGYDVPGIIRSGNDMIQPGSDERYELLLAAVKDGTLSQEALDACVTRVLELIVKTPAFKSYKFSEAPDLEAHAKVCKEAADEGIILLRNKRHTLPANPAKTVALFGTASYDFIAGGTGSGDVNKAYVVNLLDGLTSAGFKLDTAVTSFYKAYMEDEALRCENINKGKKWYIDAERAIEVVPPQLIADAAESADIAFITIGRIFGEGKDRSLADSYQLSERERSLLNKVSSAFHKKGKKVVVILNVGGLVEMLSWRKKADAIVLCWQPGQEGGHSVASVLSGAVNPSGHLPMTVSRKYYFEPSARNFPQVVADKPFNYSGYRRFKDHKRYDIKDVDYTNYEEGIYVGYRYFCSTWPRAVLYPFGYGGSYTKFAFSNMKVSPTGSGWTVTVDVKNKGKVAGKDVVQLYVEAPHNSMDKPSRELKGFAKTPLLEPGQKCTVSMDISRESLFSFDEANSQWLLEKGRYFFSAAWDAEHSNCRASVRIASDETIPVKPLFAAEPLFLNCE
ncbi:MAG: glycoside hydrolase family 3 C-terminal domain-containing protein [Bacteroidales bacterium]|nr:glycoside hydrolase family 3 C-terminal domain-containing protein [Bacteroidales bacterium]